MTAFFLYLYIPNRNISLLMRKLPVSLFSEFEPDSTFMTVSHFHLLLWNVDYVFFRNSIFLGEKFIKGFFNGSFF
jgi:hypothetical protein